MGQLDAELGRLVRRYVAGLDRTPGAVAPDSLDAQATPYHDTDSGRVVGTSSGAQPARADRDDAGPARRGSANDYGWRRQDRQEIRAYRESLVTLDVAANGTATLDPNVVTCWRVRAAGNLTLAFVAPAAPPDGGDATYVTSMVFRISRKAGSTLTWPAGTLFQKPLRDLAGNSSPLDPASQDSLDEFVAEYWPGDGWSVNSTAWRLG